MNKEASPLALGATSHNCPSCQRVLYNRRLKNCGFCGAPIPEELRFSPEESAALYQKLVAIEEERRQRQLAAEKEKEARRRRFTGDGGAAVVSLMC